MHRTRNAGLVTATTLAVTCLTSTPLRAQTVHATAISIQPVSTLVGFYSGELEHALNPSTTLGVGGSFFNASAELFDDRSSIDYLSTEVKLRYYPAEHALSGFNLGLSAGATHVSGDLNSDSGNEHSSATVGSVGFELAYNWLLGHDRNLLISTGGGAKRLFSTSTYTNVVFAYPTVRLSIGYAF